MFIKVTEFYTERVRLIRVNDVEEVYEYYDENGTIFTKMLLRKESKQTDNFFEISESLEVVHKRIEKAGE